jgi:hypothetical protein
MPRQALGKRVDRPERRQFSQKVQSLHFETVRRGKRDGTHAIVHGGGECSGRCDLANSRCGRLAAPVSLMIGEPATIPTSPGGCRRPARAAHHLTSAW